MDELDSLILGCEEAGELLLQAWNTLPYQSDVLIQNRDLKLDIDKLAEDKILQRLRPYNLSCYTEESGWVGNEDTNYVLIDGLDGTVNFSNNIPIFTVSAAVMRGSTPVAGVVVDPLNKKICSRYAGRPLSVNRQYNRLLKKNKSCAESVLLSAITPTFFENSRAIGEHMYILKKFGKVRMVGSAAWSVAMLAEGNVDAVYFPNIFRWDVMGGVALLDYENFDIKIKDHESNKDLCTLYASGNWVID